MNILYEDNHIIVVVKPENMPSQGDSSGSYDLLSAIKDYIKVKYEKPGAVYLGLVHRLDRPVTGVMVFAKTSKAAGRLCDGFKIIGSNKNERGVNKKYMAIVCGKPPKHQRLECFMKKDERTGNAVLCKEGDEGAKYASLEYTRVAQKNGLALLDIALHTGRHHQIRFQLANAGYPIYGDHRYNQQFINDIKTQIALQAYSLTLTHPTKRERMRFCYAVTSGEWELFSDEIKLLAADCMPVFIDDQVVVLDKQIGVEVAYGDAGENSLEHRLNSAGLGAFYPVHRLDATTSGLVLFARNEGVRDTLLKAFAQGEVKKFYRCEVVGIPKKAEDTLTAYLVKNADEGRVRIFDKPVENSQQIITKYRVIAKDKHTSTLEAELITGRTHQIRAHLAHIGNPIVGDDKYGDREFNKAYKASRIELRSVRLVWGKYDIKAE